MAQTYFASIQPGLEPLLLREIRALGGKRPRQILGGVEFDAARKTLYAAGLSLRTATRIWLRLDEFRSRDAPELFHKTRRFSWERLLSPGQPFSIRAHSSSSSLYHTEKIADAISDGVAARFHDQLKMKAPRRDDKSSRALLIMARLHDDRCQLSMDASGDLLHRRGWRIESGPAPLRESLAAALLLAAKWQPETGLLDPFCGSGTIVIEAAHQALNHPPGANREFSFQGWRNFDPDLFESIRTRLLARRQADLPAPIIGRDIDVDVLHTARRNADRADVAEKIQFQSADAASSSLPPGVRAIIANPPYGSRIEKGDALQSLLQLWRSAQDPTTLAFLWPRDGRDHVRRKAPSLSLFTDFENGGLPVDLWTSSH